jgi:iron complex transport system substrate-binding protein
MVLDAEPSLLLTFIYSSDDINTHPALVEAGVPVVVASDYIEASPLGQAEWIKFTALFYNAEATANAVFDEKAAAYQGLVDLTASLSDEEKPTVLWNSYTAYSNAWWIPGSESFAGQFIRDAGGTLVLGDDPQVAGNINATPFDFEVVYDTGFDADLWFPGTFGVRTLADFIAQDERNADFEAVQAGQVYNFDARENANGGNDFFENGVANPQDVLADLISIMHPELLPDHELIYYRQLPAE